MAITEGETCKAMQKRKKKKKVFCFQTYLGGKMDLHRCVSLGSWMESRRLLSHAVAFCWVACDSCSRVCVFSHTMTGLDVPVGPQLPADPVGLKLDLALALVSPHQDS